MEELKTYLEMRIRECNWELEKRYQDRTDIIRMTSLEERIKTLTEVQLFVNRKIPEAATSKGTGNLKQEQHNKERGKVQLKRENLRKKIIEIVKEAKKGDEQKYKKKVNESAKEAMDWVLEVMNPVSSLETPFLIAAFRIVADKMESVAGEEERVTGRSLYRIMRSLINETRWEEG